MVVTDRDAAIGRLGVHLDKLERKSLSRFALVVSGRCRCPVSFERTYRAMPNAGETMVAPGVTHPATILVDGEARCRRCDACLKQRSREWTARATVELLAAPRTWFGTLTLAPHEQQRVLARARLNAAESLAGDYDLMGFGEQFVRRVDVVGPELARYIKRLRKSSGVGLRYMLVVERHQSGDPHFHMLVHELDPYAPIRKICLEGQWILGFSQWRLAVPGAARYVCKYLAKTLAARVRASQGYGDASHYPALGHSSMIMEREIMTSQGEDNPMGTAHG